MHEGEHIRRIREALGLKQEYVAAEAGMHPSALCRIEKRKKLLMYREAVRLARVLGCDLAAFDDGFTGPRPTAGPDNDA